MRECGVTSFLVGGGDTRGRKRPNVSSNLNHQEPNTISRLFQGSRNSQGTEQNSYPGLLHLFSVHEPPIPTPTQSYVCLLHAGVRLGLPFDLYLPNKSCFLRARPDFVITTLNLYLKMITLIFHCQTIFSLFFISLPLKKARSSIGAEMRPMLNPPPHGKCPPMMCHPLWKVPPPLTCHPLLAVVYGDGWRQRSALGAKSLVSFFVPSAPWI